MPTYLVHGFRWPRAAIRIHIILYDLEDAAAEWIIAPASAITFLNSFYTLFDFLPPSQPPFPAGQNSVPPSPILPPLRHSKSEVTLGRRSGTSSGKGSDGAKRPLKFNDWSIVKLLEHYDPEDESCASQPFAYVADYIVPVALSLDIEAEMAAYEDRQKAETVPLVPPLPPGMTSPRPDTAPASNGNNSTPPSGLSDRDLRRKSRRMGWFDKLRDQLAKDESIGWFVVVCGDEERTVPDFSGLKIKVGKEDSREEPVRPKTPRSAGLRSFFGKRDRMPSGGWEEK